MSSISRNAGKAAEGHAAADGATNPVSHPRASHRFLERFPPLLAIYRVGVGVVSVGTIALGLFLLPLPGQGWALVFAGVWLLSREFPAAGRVLVFLERWRHGAVGVTRWFGFRHLAHAKARLRASRESEAAVGETPSTSSDTASRRSPTA